MGWWISSPYLEASLSNFVTLVVEDDALQREVIADLLRDNGLEVVECTTAEAAEIVVATTGTELLALVTDVSLAGDMSGLQLAEYAQRKFPHLNVVMIAGAGPPYVPINTRFFLKPYRANDLLDAVLA
jgi:DNA-binding NtrC family response regulator